MREEPGGPDSSFEERLKAARGRQGLDGPEKSKGFDPNGLEQSPMGIAIGYGLDWLFGTKPILTAVFVPVGGAAGVWNLWRVFAPKSGQG